MMEERIAEYLKSPRRIIDVKATDDYNLILTFDNGEVKKYVMSGMLTGVFAVLRDKQKFKNVFLDEYGNVAWNKDDSKDSNQEWNNRIDLCKDALYLDSIPYI